MAEIGKPKRTVTVPLPRRKEDVPTPAPEKEPEKEPEKVPSKVA